MTTRTHRFAAFALSLAMTLVIFSGVTSFSSPDHAGAVLARSAVDTAASAPV